MWSTSCFPLVCIQIYVCTFLFCFVFGLEKKEIVWHMYMHTHTHTRALKTKLHKQKKKSNSHFFPTNYFPECFTWSSAPAQSVPGFCTGYFILTKYLWKQVKIERDQLNSQFEGTAHHDGKDKGSKIRGDWSHCVYGEEAERDKGSHLYSAGGWCHPYFRHILLLTFKVPL